MKKHNKKYRKYLIRIIKENGSYTDEPMKKWLKQHPEHKPENLSNKHSSTWAKALKKEGWAIEESHDKVLLIKPNVEKANLMKDNMPNCGTNGPSAAPKSETMAWVGPYKIVELLDGMLDDDFPKPPESKSVYLVSVKPWQISPTPECDPLYIGGDTTGKSKRFRTRIGDLIADTFGFFTISSGNQKGAGHHSGGKSINDFCKENNLNPMDLFIGWGKQCQCHRCAEGELYKSLSPRRNKKRPALCPKHRI